MKKRLVYLFICVSLILMMSNCEDKERPDQTATISGVPESMTVAVGESTGLLKIVIRSANGLTSFSIFANGERQKAYNFSGRTSFETTFEYFPSVLEVGKPLVLEFVAVDRDGDTSTSQLLVTVQDRPNTTRISADISVDQTWETGRTYILTKKISVLPGATLTIQPGVLVKGDYTPDADLSALVIMKGAKIHAEGTQDKPIIFTSVIDHISPGELSSNLVQGHQVWNNGWDAGWTTFDSDFQGLWGGVVIFGQAKGSFAANVSEVLLQENPFGDSNWKYGGDDDTDNSGMLRYVSIRYAGNMKVANNPISSLTLGAIGSGTTIENLEIYNSYLSGVRILGGSVALKNVFVINAIADGVAIDQGWNGTLDNFYVGFSSNGIAFGGPKGTYYNGNQIIKNGNLEYNRKLLSFEEKSNCDLSGLFFMIGQVSEFMPPPPDGINMIPTYFNPAVSNFEASVSGDFDLSQLFLEWDKVVRVVHSDGLIYTGIDWSPFAGWCFGLHEMGFGF